MEFKSLKNIETSFRQIRLFSLAFICLCAVVTGFAVWSSYRFAERQREKIYVLDQGKSLMLALSQDARQNRPVEAREHVRRFHELFFTLSPDKSAIEGNIHRSLLLADKSAFNYYKDLSEKGYYNRVISGNINQLVEIDSIRCDFERYPYRDLCPADHPEGKLGDRTQPCHPLPPDGCRPERQQPAGVHHRGLRDHGEQGLADPQTVTPWEVSSEKYRTGRVTGCAACADVSVRICVWLSS